MSNPISNLNKLDLLRPQDLNCNIFSVYDYDGFSIQELLCVFFEKINECVEIANATFKLAEWLVSVGLAQEVALTLNKWLADGTLKEIINEEIFNDLNLKVNNHSENLSILNKHDENRGYINIKDLGAIGDGHNHPLSSKYETLELAKKDFPNAISLDNEIDGLALDLAIKGIEKTVYIPSGHYIINTPLIIDRRVDIFGDGKSNSVLNSTLTTGNLFTFSENSHRSTIKNFWVGSKLKGDLIPGSNVNVICFQVNTPYIDFEGLEIQNFNRGINFETRKCFVHNIDRCQIVYCNHGIFGNVEFNEINITRNCITYCDIGVYCGEGRSKNVKNNDIERNNISLKISGTGDCNVEGNYFELENDSSISITWDFTSCDIVNIKGNSFFSQNNPSTFIKYHMKETGLLFIENNMFFGSLGVDTIVNNIGKGNPSTLCKPFYKNNQMNEKCVVGVDYSFINGATFTDSTLGLHLTQITTLDLTTVDVNKISSIRIGHFDGSTVKLPIFKNMYDSRKCFKLVAFGTTGNMQIDSSTHTVVGVGNIEPNQMYSIYFNRVVDGKEEVLICKG